VLKEALNHAGTKAAQIADEIIQGALPEGAVIADLACSVYGSGVEVYSHKGVPFLELHPLKFEMDGLTLRMSRQYRKL